MHDAKPLILVVEDDADAAFLIRRLLNKTGVPLDIVHLGDGERALNYLSKVGANGPEASRPPALILLDIKMPKVNGFEVLSWIRDQGTVAVPIIVLTTSDDPSDRLKASQLGADAFVAKFPPAEDLQSLLCKLLQGKRVVS